MESVSSEHSWSSIAIGWVVIGAVTTAVYVAYSQPKKRANAAKAVTQVKQDIGKDIAAATTAMKKKADRAMKQKAKPAPAQSPSEATAAPAATTSYDPDAEAASKRDEAKANKDFAQSLSKLKSGTQFTAPKKEKNQQKSVKQSRAREAETTADVSSAHSDADDDDSSAASPVTAPADQSGVSDMLEKSAPGPSVLRLTSTDNGTKSSAKKEKAPDVVETKKQRQNRLKAESKKLEREQDEKERKKLEEAQRRRARIAEGRPAKDGSSSVSPKDNAWTAKANGEQPLMPIQPLDTFEQKPVNTPAAKSTPKPASNGTKERSDSWMSTLPSEEEQYAQVLEDTSSWNEVGSKKNKKGKKTQESSEPTEKAANVLPLAPARNPAAATKTAVDANKSKPALSSHSSFAALVPEETADDDDDEEEEWDV